VSGSFGFKFSAGNGFTILANAPVPLNRVDCARTSVHHRIEFGL